MKNKNKLLIFVMILLLISLVSTVSAGPLDALKNLQTTAASSGIIIIIVNASIIFAGVFTIFNLIKKGLDPKHAKIVQLLVVALSIILAIELNKNNPGAFLWQTRYFGNLLHPAVIINGLVIGAALMLLSDILLEKQMTPQLRWAIRIIVVIMALNIVMEPFQPDKTWDDVKDSYKYVWQSRFWIRTRFYLLGDAHCTFSEGDKVESGCYTNAAVNAAIEGQTIEAYTAGKKDVRWGILTGTRVIVFVLLFFVLVVAGKTFIKTELIGEKFIYAMSFLIASNMANTGTNIGNSVMIGQIVLSFALYYSMKDKVGKAKWVAMVIAVLLVEFVSKTIFGDKAKTFLTPVMGPFMSDVVKIFGNGFQIWDIFLLMGALLKALFLHPASLIILIIIVAILGGFGIAKGAGPIGRLLGDTGRYIGANLLKRFKGRLKLIGSKLGWKIWAALKRPIKPDSWPYIMMENRAILYFNQQWIKRAEIFYHYWAVVQSQLPRIKHMIEVLGEHGSLEQLKKDLIYWRSGDHVELEGGMEVKGWNRSNEDVIELVNEALEFLANVRHRIQKVDEFPTLVGVINGRRGDNFSGRIKTRAEQLMSKITRVETALELCYNKKWVPRFVSLEEGTEGKEKRSAYGLHNVIDLARTFCLDLANISAYGNHYFKFVPANTIFTNGVDEKTGFEIQEEDPSIVKVKDIVEVNQDYCISNNEQWRVRQNQILKPVEHSRLPKPIIIDYPNYLEVLQWLNTEWESFVYDMRDGRYHPGSKLAKTYYNKIQDGTYHDILIPKDPNVMPDGAHPAFDLRAMENPSRVRFGSRPYFDSPKEKVGLTYYNGRWIPKIGDVWCSSEGFKLFFYALIHKDTVESEDLNNFLRTIPVDLIRAGPEETFGTLAEFAPKEGKE